MATTQVDGKAQNSTPRHARALWPIFPQNWRGRVWLHHGQHLAYKILSWLV